MLAHAFYPLEMMSFGGDIHFDNDENWKENASQLAEGEFSYLFSESINSDQSLNNMMNFLCHR